MNKPTGLAAFTRKGRFRTANRNRPGSRAPSSRQKPVSVDEEAQDGLP